MKNVTSELLLDGDDLTIKHSQDLSGVKDYVDSIRADNNGWSQSRELKAQYFIPDLLLVEFMNKGHNFFTKEGRAWILKEIKKPEYSYLKI